MMGAHVLMFDVRFPFLSSDFMATKVQNEFFPYLQIRIRSAGARCIKYSPPPGPAPRPRPLKECLEEINKLRTTDILRGGEETPLPTYFGPLGGL